jgi:D-amino-acid dehydrogenase
MITAGRAIQALLVSSRSLYDELMATESFDCEWETRGLLYVHRDRAAMDEYATVDRLLGAEFGLSAVRYEGDELTALEPALVPGLAGGWHYPGDAHLRPDKLLESWHRILEGRGITIRLPCEVTGIASRSERARALLTSGGEIEADAFVFATGAWTPRLHRVLGVRLPIQPGKGYSMTMRRPASCPVIPLIFPSHGIAVTPMRSGYRLGSTLEFAGYDTGIRRSRLDYLADAARRYLREPLGEPVEEEWYGWRPMTYDGKPIIGRSPAISNLVIAAGHNMLGVSMAPATGKLVAELLSDLPPHLDPVPYAPTRF